MSPMWVSIVTACGGMTDLAPNDSRSPTGPPTASTPSTPPETEPRTETGAGRETAAVEEETAVEAVPPPDDGVVEDTAIEVLPGVEDPAAFLFGGDRVVSIDVTLSTDAVNALYADPYTYVEGAVTIDGRHVSSVGVRLRGKIGSFQTLDGKPKFGLDFNAFLPGGEFYGLERLNLNNATVDPSYVREHIGYLVFRELGIAAPRTGYAWVKVNGADYGLYVSLEAIDERLLGRWFPDPTGNLYDGKYVWYGGWSYTLLDFQMSTYNLYQLEEGADVAWADTLSVTQALAAPTPDFWSGVGAVVDLDHHVQMVAAEQWIGQLDGYSLNQNNNWVYFDPADGGRAHILPYDLDYAFLQDWQWGMNWYAPRGLITAGCMNDPVCRGAWRTRSLEANIRVDGLVLDAEIERVAAVIAPYVAVDGRDWSDAATTEAWQATMIQWVTVRSSEIRSFWGG